MSAARRALLEQALIAVLFVGGTLLQLSRAGIDAAHLALAIVLLGPAYRRARTLVGRADGVPWPVFGLELLSFSGLVLHPSGGWGLGFAGLAGFVLIISRDRRDEPVTRSELVGLGGLALATVLIGLFRGQGDSRLLLSIGLLAVHAARPGASWRGAAVELRVVGLTFGIVAGVLLHQRGLTAEALLWGLVLTGVLGLMRDVLPNLYRPVPVVPLRISRAMQWILAVDLAAFVALFVVGPLLAPERRLDLAAFPKQPVKGHLYTVVLPLFTLATMPENPVVTEDGKPLPLRTLTHWEIERFGHGRYCTLSGRQLHWSSLDGTNPLENGRRYEVTFAPDYTRSVPAEGLFVATGILLLVAWSCGVVSLARPSPWLLRAGLVVTLGLGVAAGIQRSWNETIVSLDTESYVHHFTSRTVLYPSFLAALDGEPGRRDDLRLRENGLSTDPNHRFIAAPRMQKLLTTLALVALVAAMATEVNAWLIGIILVAGLLLDRHLSALVIADASVAYNTSSLLTEGINHALVFAYLATAFAYLTRPRRWLVIALGGTLALLALNRPANTSLMVVLPFVWARIWWSSGARRATLELLLVAATAGIPVGLECLRNQRLHGHFSQHAFTGANIIGEALQVATSADVAAFDNPAEARFVRECLTSDLAAFKVPEGPGGDHVNANLYKIALPAAERTLTLPEGTYAHAYALDAVFKSVGTKLIRLHPLAFASLVAYHASLVFDPWLDGCSLLALLCALYGARGRSVPRFALVFLVVVPWVAIAPACAFNVPNWRYQSQFHMIRVCALPLVLAVLASVAARAVPAGPSLDGSDGAAGRSPPS